MDQALAGLDLLRKEYRFFLSSEPAHAFFVELRRDWKEIHFSDSSYVLTIYLESDEHEVPFGTSVKARRFLQTSPPTVSLDWNQRVRFEIKGTRHETTRLKTAPKLLSLIDAVQEARLTLDLPALRPYLAVGYRRSHFVPSGGAPMRFTVDQGLRYWFFEPVADHVVSLGEEQILRLEAKVPVGSEEHPDWLELRRLLSIYGALPINSKRNEGLARIGQYLAKHFGIGIERDLSGFEIEAKLLVRHEEPPVLFRQLKEWTKVETASILLPSHFPFTVDAETVNQYWSEEAADGQSVDGLKILLRGDHFGSVEKTNTEVLDAELGIVKRKETKGYPILYSPKAYQNMIASWSAQVRSPRFLGHLTRWRRAIWPEEQTSRRIYHISLDRCVTAARPEPLWQIEIEYVGRLECGSPPSGDLERTVVGEIQHLVRVLLNCANREQRVLEPITLTKFQWLAGV